MIVRSFVPVFAVLALFVAGSASSQTCRPGARSCSTELIAGQNYEAGSLTLVDNATINDSGDLVLRIAGDDGWTFSKVHLYVGKDPVPVNGAGKPAPGRFPYHFSFPGGTDDHLIVLPLDGLDAGCFDVLDIALHLEMKNGSQHETGWAFGDDSFRKAWGWSFQYQVGRPALCEEPS